MTVPPTTTTVTAMTKTRTTMTSAIMKTTKMGLLAIAVLIGGAGRVAGAADPASPSDKTVVHRFALIVGASQGGPDRVPLRFAASDGVAVRRVLADLGGLGEGSTVVLTDAGRAAVHEGFDRMRRMIAAAHAPGARTEMIFYYSGHSDENGLLLGQERVSYPEVRAWVDETGAEVRIAVLDSCASGALTRGKGGVHRPPFLVDNSSAARGHAYLTASAENEAAQESDRLGAAYFTHYLVSGLRGAADVSHDGRVTLSEAYQYAFTETLARTQQSRGGPQHASYDFQLAGKGDLVMTDLRATSASLLLPAALSGRLFVRDAQGQLVAEVHKLPAQPIELGLPPGRYRVTLDDSHRLSEGTIELAAGKPSALDPSTLIAMQPVPGRARGAGGGDGLEGDGAEPAATASAAAAPVDIARPRALNFSIFPGFDTDGGIPSDDKVVFGFFAHSRTLDGLSLSLGTRVLGDVHGAQIAGIGHLVGGDVHGTQIAGLANVVNGSVSGVQVAGLTNWGRGSAHAIQVAGLYNSSVGSSSGVQLGGLANTSSGDYRGGQVGGIANLTRGNFEGVQVGGVANVARGNVVGAQVAGISNLSGDLTGAQIGVVNIGGDVTGAQIGVVNIARRVRGTQIGLVDIATEGDAAAPIGLITFVREGIHELELTTNEALTPVLSGVLGTRHFYTRLGIGRLAAPSSIPGGRNVTPGSVDDRRSWFWQWGLGGRIRLTDRWFFDVEGLVQQLSSATDQWNGLTFGSDNKDALLASARLLIGFRLAPPVTVVLGPSYNVGVGWNGSDPVTGPEAWQSVHRDGSTTVRTYPGLTLGIRI